MSPLIAAAIPTIIKALASPIVSGTAASWIAEKFGLADSTVEAVSNFMNNLGPDHQIRLQELENEFKTFVIQQNNQIYLAELGLIQAQLDINKTEAAHPSVFVAGWRPALGWTGVVALGLAVIPKSLVLTTVWTIQAIQVISTGTGTLPQFPDLGITDVVTLLGTIIGVGTMRSFDKYHEVDTKSCSRRL